MNFLRTAATRKTAIRLAEKLIINIWCNDVGGAVMMWTSVTIAGINAVNYGYSPRYNPEVDCGQLQLTALSIIKGMIYGTFYPISLTKITIDIFRSSDKFYQHFIPFSYKKGSNPISGLNNN